MNDLILNEKELKILDEIIYILYQKSMDEMYGDIKNKIKKFNKQRDLLLKIKEYANDEK